MSEGQPRDEGGEFGEKVTQQDILLVFETVNEPFLTTAEVAEHLPISKKATYQRLNQMHEEGDVGKKKTGARSVGWWAKVAPRLDPDVAADLEEDEEPAISHEELKAELGAE